METDGHSELIGGDFTTFDGLTRKRVARLDASGNLDTVFNPPGGADYSVRALLVQPDGRVVVGGFFTNIAGITGNLPRADRKRIGELFQSRPQDFIRVATVDVGIRSAFEGLVKHRVALPAGRPENIGRLNRHVLVDLGTRLLAQFADRRGESLAAALHRRGEHG